MKINKEKYKDWDIYYSFNDTYKLEELGKKIVDCNFFVDKVLKDTKRNYVAIIKINEIKYILKEFRSECIIPQRHIQTIFKDGEALTTLKNSLEAIEEGIDEIVVPLVAVVKRKKMIEKSCLLMEYIEGENLKTIEDIKKVIEISKKIHKLERYHGDMNTSNFIKTNAGIKVIDTQMKKEKFIFFKRGYDILTLKEDLLVKFLKYDVLEDYIEERKFLGYFFAKFLKRLKKIKIIENIKLKKKILREKGWKI